jgi:hypothetical protein
MKQTANVNNGKCAVKHLSLFPEFPEDLNIGCYGNVLPIRVPTQGKAEVWPLCTFCSREWSAISEADSSQL